MSCQGLPRNIIQKNQMEGDRVASYNKSNDQTEFIVITTAVSRANVDEGLETDDAVSVA